jgi:hypothetical protein
MNYKSKNIKIKKNKILQIHLKGKNIFMVKIKKIIQVIHLIKQIIRKKML